VNTDTLFDSEPFSYKEVKEAQPVNLIKPQFIKASDGIDLAYYHFRPDKKPLASIVFIHGAGAHCGLSSYQRIGSALKDMYTMESYLLDLRGHGNSGGSRGHTPRPCQVWNDVKTVVNFIKSKNTDIPIVLCGHSAGAGATINYATWDKRTEVDGYIVIAPYLGFRSGTSRRGILKDPFAHPKVFNFAMNLLSFGLFFGDKVSVFYNYSEERLKNEPLLVNSITCNMSAACTLWNPAWQFRKMTKPLGLYIGSDDELFDPGKVLGFYNRLTNATKARSEGLILEQEKHLSILVDIDKNINDFILNKIR
jgi:acylglycerol lipase